jgi:hypothetical protein
MDLSSDHPYSEKIYPLDRNASGRKKDLFIKEKDKQALSQLCQVVLKANNPYHLPLHRA